jgi:hypothetical protein
VTTFKTQKFVHLSLQPKPLLLYLVSVHGILFGWAYMFNAFRWQELCMLFITSFGIYITVSWLAVVLLHSFNCILVLIVYLLRSL